MPTITQSQVLHGSSKRPKAVGHESSKRVSDAQVQLDPCLYSINLPVIQIA